MIEDALRKLCRPEIAEQWRVPLEAAMQEREINTPARMANFISQMAHESDGFRHLREIWNPEKVPAQAHYEGRADLGNTEVGDGFAFRGWGPPQITGRKNTSLASMALYGDLRLIENPLMINTLSIADHCRVAAWFWTVGAGLNLGRAAHAHGIQDGCNLNDLADAGDRLGITLAINGGTNGLDQRERNYTLIAGDLGVVS